ncbi:MAG: hypothetical protein K0R54_668 [Clostridiaceae bacterium]|jgi:hypothetical protein|nr:hypothetical protein [Clostridiaceae bacterium]
MLKSLYLRGKNKVKEKNGSVSVDAVISMTFFLLLFSLTLAFFVYLYPQISLQKEVSMLGNIAELQGGLTEEDITQFQSSLENNFTYVANSEFPVIVTAIAEPSGTDATNVTPLGEIGNDYIKRGSKEIIRINIQVPANGKYLKAVANVFGVSDIKDYYVFSEPVMSERY